MKKRNFLVIMIIVGLLVAAPAFGQVSLSEIDDAFAGFADDVANSLAMNSTIGLQWSDAYIGQLLGVPPHFGAGVAVGATTIPIDAMQTALDALAGGATGAGDLSAFALAGGIPLPGYVLDARIGGFLLPFDIGVKAGYLEPTEIPGLGAQVDYLLVGADVRFSIIKGLLLPNLSVGVGVNYLSGGISLPGFFSAMDLANFDVTGAPAGPYTVSLTDPSLDFSWQTTVIDVKAQVSKQILFITPYAGIGASYARSTAGGGFAGDIAVTDGTATPVTGSDLQDLQDAYDAMRNDDPDLPAIDFTGSEGVSASSSVPGWGLRVFAGTSLNLLLLKVDVGGMYNLLTGDLGANVGVRVQL